VKVPEHYLKKIGQIPDIGKSPLKYVFENLGLEQQEDELWLEFGVYKGSTINYFSQFAKGKVFGFDSFEGLPEDWRGPLKKGFFDTKGVMPEVRDNVVLIKGWFDQTLPDFLIQHPGKKVSFVHVDCDLYSSTKFVLDTLKDLLVPGCVLVFDELVNYPGYDGDNGELRAWYEFISENDVEYEWLGMNGKIGMYKVDYEKAIVRIDRVLPR